MTNATVTYTMEGRLHDKMMSGLTRRQAAEALLFEKPSWYVQTPEGEYLMKVAEEELR